MTSYAMAVRDERPPTSSAPAAAGYASWGVRDELDVLYQVDALSPLETVRPAQD
jgi:hypothetical protein